MKKYTELTKRLKSLRLLQGMTQKDVGDKLGVNAQTYGCYERGYSEPDVATLAAIADLYDVSIDYLTGKTDDPEEASSPESEKNAASAAPELADDVVFSPLMKEGIRGLSKADRLRVEGYIMALRESAIRENLMNAMRGGGPAHNDTDDID